jgi:hypothetical protein
MLNHDFIHEIVEEHRAGFGFVPFVGSGLSVASGIITAQNFDSFLANTVRLCCDKQWNLPNDGWPPYPTREGITKTRDWIGIELAKLKKSACLSNRLFSLPKSFEKIKSQILDDLYDERASARDILTLLNEAVDPQGNRQTPTWTTKAELNERAVLSLRDWRATLVFLASLRYDRDTERNVLTAINTSVIDSFSTHITRGRRRNLAHSMLCHLASRMRMRVILTTNFDTLIEDAFAELGEPLRVLQVSNKGALPSAQTVHSMNCCIKLHGELHETRADFTLNDAPSLDDLATFFHYVRGRARSDGTSAIPLRFPGKESSEFIPSHLLVCGYSGSDERCRRMIEYVLDCDKGTKVFWICHTEASMDWLLEKTRLREFKEKQFFVTQTERTDLLLYQLYQRVTLSLPRGGFNYQFNHNYPPADWQHADRGETDEDPESKSFDQGAIKRRVRGAHNGLERMSRLCHALAVNKQCIWLELEDYSDVYGVAQELFQIISLRSGNYEIEHTSFIPRRQAGTEKPPDETEWTDRIQCVMAAWRLRPEDYVIFIYGRNGPGGRRGWAEDWDGVDHYWKVDGQLKDFRVLLDGLIRCGFSVVYAPYDTNRRKAEQALYGEVLSEGVFGKVGAAKVFPFALAPEGVSICDDEPWGEDIPTLENQSQWTQPIKRLKKEIDELDKRAGSNEKAGSHDLRRFLFDASLFRQSRHYSALISEPLIACPRPFNSDFIDNDIVRDEITKEWLKADWLTPLLREKRGGYLWLYRHTRMAFRILAAERTEPGATAVDKLAEKLSKAHFGIGNWYQEAFCATSHAEPLLEALYHFWQAALHAHEESHRSRIKTDPIAQQQYVLDRCRVSLFSWIKLMRLGRDSLRFWTNKDEAKAWFDFSRDPAQKEFDELKKRLEENKNPSLEQNLSEWMVMMREESERHIEPFSQLSEDFVRHSEWSREACPVPRIDYRQCFQEVANGWKQGGNWYESWGRILEKEGKTFRTITELLTSTDRKLASRGGSKKNLADEIVDNALEETKDSNESGSLYTLVQHLFELTYSQLRRAKLIERRLIRKPGDGTYLSRFGEEWQIQGDDVLAEWVKICVLCRVMLDLCMHLHPNLWEADFRMRVTILGNYALALGKLGRFHEAHRRLNEAHAIRSRVTGHGRARDFGIIKLRRAELHLLEANLLADLFTLKDAGSIKKTETREHLEKRYDVTFSGVWSKEEECKLYRMHLAKLDDAWMNLERAEEWLKGHSHSSLWWGRLIALQMRVFADRLDVPPEDKSFPWRESFRGIKGIAFREPRDRLDYLRSLFRKGENCLAGKPYQILRLFHYYTAAEKKLTRNGKYWDDSHGQAKETEAEFERLEGVCDWLLTQYGDNREQENLDWEYFGNLRESIEKEARRETTPSGVTTPRDDVKHASGA